MLIEKTISAKQIQDEELEVRRAQQDPQTFRVLYEAHFKRIFLFVHHRIGDKATSADLTSQVFFKALINIKSFKFKGLPFSAWLYRIAVNECHEFFRKNNRYRMVAVEEEGVAGLYEEMMEQSSLEELELRLPEILGRLKEDELMLIELRFFEQKAFKEVAKILGITENHAKVRTYRILEKMKRFFLVEKDKER